jgi:hypothetical protein
MLEHVLGIFSWKKGYDTLPGKNAWNEKLEFRGEISENWFLGVTARRRLLGILWAQSWNMTAPDGPG